MDYNFLSVEDFLELEDSGTLLEIGTYDGEDSYRRRCADSPTGTTSVATRRASSYMQAGCKIVARSIQIMPVRDGGGAVRSGDSRSLHICPSHSD